MIHRLTAALISGGARVLTGARSRWIGCGPTAAQRIYLANHTSHVDFVLIWSVLPVSLRRCTRPVAAGDYWERGPLRRYLIHRVFRGVLVARGHIDRDHNPIDAMCHALDDGSSLILFPEGTRGRGDDVQPFKSGIYHLAHARPDIELVPVWIDNGYRVMPKGAPLPLPLLCSVAFGQPLRLEPGEHRPEFLDRLRQAVIEAGKS
jgi:1-acyl-sn-glycerol-3-phosphate acyltransferase